MPNRRDKIRKRKDGRWEGRYFKERRPDGKIRYASVYAGSYREVKQKLREAAARTDYKVTGKKNFFTVKEVGARWLTESGLEIKASTRMRYEFLLEAHIYPVLGDVKISELTEDRVRAFTAEKLEKGRKNGKGGLSGTYVRSILLVLTELQAYAVRENLCLPFKGAVGKLSYAGTQKQALSEEEFRKLENYLRSRGGTAELGILLAMYTGLRVGELCALQWGDVDQDRKMLRVRHTVELVKKEDGAYLCLAVPKTRHSLRVIPLHDALLPLLEKNRCGDDCFVATGTKNFLNPATCQYRFHKILKAAGLPEINFHTLRHTFTTRCIAAGMDLKTLSCILGHASSRVTLDIYTHPTNQQMREEMNKLGSRTAPGDRIP